MAPSDRRAEHSHSADGPLRFVFDDPARQEVEGRLMDYSNSGFRALHTGQVVEFQQMIAVGKARVMWNRIADDAVETGFLILK